MERNGRHRGQDFRRVGMVGDVLYDLEGFVPFPEREVIVGNVTCNTKRKTDKFPNKAAGTLTEEKIFFWAGCQEVIISPGIHMVAFP